MTTLSFTAAQLTELLSLASLYGLRVIDHDAMSANVVGQTWSCDLAYRVRGDQVHVRAYGEAGTIALREIRESLPKRAQRRALTRAPPRTQ